MFPLLRHGISAVASALGCIILPNWQVDSLALERHLRRLFDLLDIDCVFDVGANLGQYGNFLRRQVGFGGLIVSVEPLSACAARLRAMVADDPLWQIHQVALGAEPGRLPINVTHSSDFSSFLEPDASAIDLSAANHTVSVEEVEVMTFDALVMEVRKTHSPQRIYLKMDTQGYDLEVMKGVRSAEDSILALQSEMSVIPIYRGMPDHNTAMQSLMARGYHLSGLFNVTVENGFLVEYDCVMVRSGQ
jgi:FkbM family methyltransferase